MATTPTTVPAAKRPAPPVSARNAELNKRDEAERLALVRAQHARRLMSVFEAGYTITGVRLSDPKSDHAEGEVITFDREEQGKIVALVRELVAARK